MTIQLSQLRVGPDLDPSKFVQGAQQLNAAASSAGKAVAGVGVASDEVNRKISQAGDVVGRLSRQYVDGYASAQRFQSALNSLSREMEKGNLTISRAQPILDGIYKKYGLMGDAAQFAAKGQMELAAAITNANARIEQQRRIVPANGNMPVSSGMARAAGFNVGQQLQDVAMMAALGQSPLTMALQQGPQIASAIEQGGGLAALRSGLASLLSPTMGITIALTAAAGAAIQFSTAIFNRGKNIDDVLKGHKSLIDEITKSFPQAAAAAKQYEDQAKLLPQSVVSADTAQQAKDETEAYQKALRDFRVQFNLLVQGDSGQADFARVGKAGVAAFAEISKGIKTGQIDAIELQRRLGELRLNPDLSKSTRDFYKALQDAVNPAAELERHMQGTAAAVHGIAGGFNGPGGLPIYLDPNAGAYDRNKALSDEQTQLARTRRSFTADIAGVTARSPLERAGAARLQAAAQVNEGETPQERQLRIDLAGQRALIEAQHQLDEAQRQRKRSLDATLSSQQLDLDVIGKTTGQIAAMRLEFQLTQQLREEAARNNVPVDQKELELIKQKAAAYGKMADQIARAQIRNDLAFGREQLFRTSLDASIASQLRGTGIGLDSPEAREMRAQSDVANIHNSVDTFFSTFTQEATTQGKSIGQALMDALQAGIYSELNSLIKGMTDQFTAWLTQWISKMAGFGGAGLAANDNYSPGSIVSAALPAIRAANQNVPATMAAYAASIRSMESSGNYSALGPVLASGDRAYGAYGVMGANIGPWSRSALGYSLTPSQFLGSHSAQDAVFARQFGSYLQRFGNSNDAASAWFTGRPLATGAGAMDVFGTTGQGYVDQFNANLKNMAGTAGMATQGLSAFGSGANQVGQSMMQAANGASSGGGGGLFGWLGNLFGFGGSSLFPAAPTGVPINSLTPADYGFAAGTPSAPPGWAWVGERGPELMNFRGGETVVPSHVSMRVARGYASGTPSFGNAIAGNQNAPIIQIIDNAGVKKRTERSKGPNGQDVVKIVLDAVKADYADGGFDDMNSALYGVRRNGTAR